MEERRVKPRHVGASSAACILAGMCTGSLTLPARCSAEWCKSRKNAFGRVRVALVLEGGVRASSFPVWKRQLERLTFEISLRSSLCGGSESQMMLFLERNTPHFCHYGHEKASKANRLLFRAVLGKFVKRTLKLALHSTVSGGSNWFHKRAVWLQVFVPTQEQNTRLSHTHLINWSEADWPLHLDYRVLLANICDHINPGDRPPWVNGAACVKGSFVWLRLDVFALTQQIAVTSATLWQKSAKLQKR